MTSDLMSRMVVDGLDREAWLDARSGRADGLPKIGGSDAAKFSKPESAHLYIRDKLDDAAFTGNQYTRHGNDRERHMLAAYRMTQNLALFHAEGNRQHVATPDSFIQSATYGLVIAECKTSSKPLPKVPLGYQRQCQWNLYVTGANRCLFIWEEHDQFSPVGMEPQSVWIDPDPGMIADLVHIADLVLEGMATAAQFRKELER